MKRYAWFAAPGVVLAAAVAWGASRADQPTSVKQEQAAMPVLVRNIQRADRIQIIRRGVTLTLERRGQVWGLAQNGGYPVRSAMAEALLNQLLAMRLSRPGPSSLAAYPQAAALALTGIRVLATDGTGLGALIVADHAAGATGFPAHPLGDPQDWLASGALDAPAEPMAWIDTRILPLDPARVTGAAGSIGTGSFTLDAADAAERLAALQAMVFSDMHPAAQIRAPEEGRLTFALRGNVALTVSVQVQMDRVWLALSARRRA